mmetsp:Transcript_53890/g.125732  ORF Transcript_53890/g.125732 Transcript_53890/m.125732 type:complete len:190 (-) Transcript_53890:114-683(-)
MGDGTSSNVTKTRLCLYGTDAQRHKLTTCKRRPAKSARETHQGKGAVEAALQVLGKSWLQDALGCARVPAALCKDVWRALQPLERPQVLCLNCAVQEKLKRALQHLQITHLETERRTEALAEQYAAVLQTVTSVQRSTCGEVGASKPSPAGAPPLPFDSLRSGLAKTSNRPVFRHRLRSLRLTVKGHWR